MSNTINVDQFDLQRFAEWLGDQNLKFDGINKWKATQETTFKSSKEFKEIWYTTEQLVNKWLKESKINA